MKCLTILISVIFLFASFYTSYSESSNPKDSNNIKLPSWYKKDISISELKDDNGLELPQWLKDWYIKNQPVRAKKEDFYYKITDIINYKPVNKKNEKPVIITTEETEKKLMKLFEEEYKNMTLTGDNARFPDWAKKVIDSNRKDSKKDSFGNSLPDWAP